MLCSCPLVRVLVLDFRSFFPDRVVSLNKVALGRSVLHGRTPFLNLSLEKFRFKESCESVNMSKTEACQIDNTLEQVNACALDGVV
jgi:hypothetical protein